MKKTVKRIPKHFLRRYVAKNVGLGTDNFDFSYYPDLNPNEKQWLKTFLDEYYHNVYVKDNKKSTLNCPFLYKKIKDDSKLADEFNHQVKALNADRVKKGETRIYGLKALKKLLQLQNGERKREEENCILNSCVTGQRKAKHNMDNVEGALKTVEEGKKLEHIENMMTFNQVKEYAEEEKEFLLYIKQGKFEIYLANKIIELIELKEISETSKKMISFIEQLKTDFNNKEIKTTELYRRLYSIYQGLNNIYKNSLDIQTNKIVNNIFNNIIFNSNNYKQRTYYEEIKGKRANR